MIYLSFYFVLVLSSFFFFFNDTATTEIYTLSLHDALPICIAAGIRLGRHQPRCHHQYRSEEHTSELQSRLHLVCRLLLEKKKNKRICLYHFKKKKHIYTKNYSI